MCTVGRGGMLGTLIHPSKAQLKRKKYEDMLALLAEQGCKRTPLLRDGLDHSITSLGGLSKLFEGAHISIYCMVVSYDQVSADIII
eukprot:1190636-Prorocentrum_minimum.AAC.1